MDGLLHGICRNACGRQTARAVYDQIPEIRQIDQIAAAAPEAVRSAGMEVRARPVLRQRNVLQTDIKADADILERPLRIDQIRRDALALNAVLGVDLDQHTGGAQLSIRNGDPLRLLDFFPPAEIAAEIVQQHAVFVLPDTCHGKIVKRDLTAAGVEGQEALRVVRRACREHRLLCAVHIDLNRPGAPDHTHLRRAVQGAFELRGGQRTARRQQLHAACFAQEQQISAIAPDIAVHGFPAKRQSGPVILRICGRLCAAEIAGKADLAL